MGLSGVHIWELVLVLVVFLLLFGSKKLPGLASDLGAAIRSFRRSLAGDQPADAESPRSDPRQDPGGEKDGTPRT